MAREDQRPKTSILYVCAVERALPYRYPLMAQRMQCAEAVVSLDNQETGGIPSLKFKDIDVIKFFWPVTEVLY